MNIESIELLRHKIYQIERALRSLRNQFEIELVDSIGYIKSIKPKKSLKTGLSNLLMASDNIDQREVSPYEQFYPGVAFAYSAEAEGNRAFVTSYVFNSGLEGVESSSCLIAKVTLDRENPSKWFTLETQIDLEELKNSSSISINFTPCFRFVDENKYDNLNIVIRGFTENSYRDYYPTSFPSLKFPMEFTYIIDNEKFSAIPFSDFSSISIIIFLPTNCTSSYIFTINNFEVESNN